jgi:ADP-ribose pyrophosphatase YjhB (NUDIX family)
MPAEVSGIPERPTRVEGFCVDRSGLVLMVRRGGEQEWIYPGGRPEVGETPTETLSREVAEEACATVLSHRYLGCYRLIEFNGSEEVRTDYEAVFGARVLVHAWEPRFETVDRTLVAREAVLDTLYYDPEAEPLVRTFLEYALPVTLALPHPRTD